MKRHPSTPFFARAIVIACAALLMAASSWAASADPTEAGTTSSEANGDQSLAQAAEDPTASLMSLQVSDWYTAGFHGLDDEDANAVVLRPVIPFKTGKLDHIFP